MNEQILTMLETLMKYKESHITHQIQKCLVSYNQITRHFEITDIESGCTKNHLDITHALNEINNIIKKPI